MNACLRALATAAFLVVSTAGGARALTIHDGPLSQVSGGAWGAEADGTDVASLAFTLDRLTIDDVRPFGSTEHAFEVRVLIPTAAPTFQNNGVTYSVVGSARFGGAGLPAGDYTIAYEHSSGQSPAPIEMLFDATGQNVLDPTQTYNALFFYDAADVAAYLADPTGAAEPLIYASSDLSYDAHLDAEARRLTFTRFSLQLFGTTFVDLAPGSTLVLGPESVPEPSTAALALFAAGVAARRASRRR